LRPLGAVAAFAATAAVAAAAAAGFDWRLALVLGFWSVFGRGATALGLASAHGVSCGRHCAARNALFSLAPTPSLGLLSLVWTALLLLSLNSVTTTTVVAAAAVAAALATTTSCLVATVLVADALSAGADSNGAVRWLRHCCTFTLASGACPASTYYLGRRRNASVWLVEVL